MSTHTIRGGPRSRPPLFSDFDHKPAPITTVDELHAAATERFCRRPATDALLRDAEQWRRVVAPFLPAEFEGVYRYSYNMRAHRWCREIIGINLVDKSA